MLFSTVAFAAIAGSSLVGAAPILEARKEAPDHWKHNILENYLDYHTRYLALSCYEKHDTEFFSQCCRPLRSNDQLTDRPAECTPSDEALEAAKTRVAAKAGANATAPTEDAAAAPSDDAVSQYVSHAVAQQTEAAAPTPTAPVEAFAAVDPTSTAAEEPKSTEQAAPETTEQAAPEPTKEAAPEPTKESNNNGQTYSGKGTYYLQKEGAHWSGLGSCGWKNSDADFIAAISTTHGSTWGNSRCGQMIKVTNQANGKSVDVQIVDTCPSCDTADSIDLSLPAFLQIAEQDTGRIDIDWHFI